jgi:hypothetical protein
MAEQARVLRRLTGLSLAVSRRLIRAAHEEHRAARRTGARRGAETRRQTLLVDQAMPVDEAVARFAEIRRELEAAA